jgi:uncharacterized small protein (DUF1192 family)
MDTDDLEPQPKPKAGPDLETLSIGELKEHIAALEAEIAHIKAMIAAKEAQRGSAEQLFKR